MRMWSHSWDHLALRYPHSHPVSFLSEDLVFKLYVRAQVGKIDDILKNLASTQSYAVEEPHGCHAQPFTTQSSFLFRTSEAIENARGNTVVQLIRVQQDLLDVETGGNPIQEGAWALNNLAIDVARLDMYLESLVLCTWTVDLYKTLSKSHWAVYAPHLALVSYNLAVAFYRTGDVAQAMALTKECLSLLKTYAPTFATEALKACMLSESAHFRCAMGEHSSASLQDAADSVNIWECLGADKLAVIGSQQGGNHTISGLHLTGGDRAVHRYAYALDAQREFLYDIERYQEALDVGERALRLYRMLGERYKHIDIQSQVASLCHFLCDDVFRDAIPLSSALNYAQEAVQIWEEVHEITRADEEHILDSLAMQTKILVEVGRPSNALTTFLKLARRVRFMATNQRMYIQNLQYLASRLFDEGYYLEVATASRTIVEICRQSVDFVPTSQGSLPIEILLDHIGSCACANYLSEAQVHSDEALAIAGQKPRVKDTASTERYFNCLDWAAFLSIEAGYPQQAINQIQDALDVDPVIQKHLIGCDSEVLDHTGIKMSLISLKALAFLRLGQLSLAAATIADGYEYAESAASALNLQEERYYARLLHVSALVHRCTGKREDALTAIKAAIPIFEYCGWDQQLYTLSDVLADMGYDAEALHIADKAVESTKRRACLSSILNHKHKTSQYSLCLRLFFNGEFSRARQVILEVRAFYEWHAHSRNAWFINLARALRAEGILECASGRHVEGAAARARLDELQQRL
ncbi:hypothetical protein CPC08DRAFT_434878 [Agrocybe pediades]|nr:hypothetical protein CPC08DRAFT_434878 [Agrocybe pediades]